MSALNFDLLFSVMKIDLIYLAHTYKNYEYILYALISCPFVAAALALFLTESSSASAHLGLPFSAW